MKAFITGINGFVGNHLSDFLLSRGFEVLGMDVSEGCKKGVRCYKADLLAVDEVREIIDEVRPDYVFHLAGFSSVKKSFEQPELCRKINVDGTKNLLDAIEDVGINPKILIVTSAEIYGIPKMIPIKETHELNPDSPYGESRKEQEELCKKYDKLNIVISRSFPHVGPGQQPLFVVSDFSKQIVEIEKGKEPVMGVGNLEAKRDFTDVRDVVKAYLLAVEKCNRGEVYNICSGNVYSIQEVLDKLLSMSELNIEVEQDESKMRPSDIPVLQGDNSKFREKTGWSPEIGIEDTLKDVLNYWRKTI